MNNLAAAALVLPSAIDAGRRTGVKTSKLLIPVAYGSLLGGVATYGESARLPQSSSKSFIDGRTTSREES